MPKDRGSDRSLANGDNMLAVRMRNVRKEYKLYNSPADQALDVLGLSRLRFWRAVKHKMFSALDGIDLEIAAGERVGIVGRNGAGKTTLLKLITRNFLPSAGEIEINGEVQALMHTGVGFHGEFTGYENIRSSLIYNGLTKGDYDRAVEDVIDFCELGEFLYQPVKTYSQGMLTRLQFATATAINPDVVIIDEVLGAGDAYFSGKSVERVKKLTHGGATLLLVSHSISQILQFSERVIWLEQGRIVMDGEPLEVVNHYEEYIHTMEREAAGGEKTSSVVEALTDIPKWILEKHKTTLPGRDGADWGGNGPLRLVKLTVVDQSGNPATQLLAGQKFSIQATITSERSGSFPCSCLFVIYDEGGNVVSRLVEPERTYELNDGDTVTVTASLEANPIGGGRYILSAGLFANYDLISPEKGHRYHILSRGLQLTIKSAVGSDDSRIRLLPNWNATVATEPPIQAAPIATTKGS